MRTLCLSAALALVAAAMPAMAEGGPSSLPPRGCENTPISEMTRPEIIGCEMEATLQKNTYETVRRQREGFVGPRPPRPPMCDPDDRSCEGSPGGTIILRGTPGNR